MSLERRERRKYERLQKKLIQKYHLMNIQKFKGMTNEQIEREITKHNPPQTVQPTEVTEEMIEELYKTKED
jgi:hypothetical protein